MQDVKEEFNKQKFGKNQMEILEMKNSISKIKNSVESPTNRLD